MPERSRRSLRQQRKRAVTQLRVIRDANPWDMAADLREALFLLGENPTDEELELLDPYD